MAQSIPLHTLLSQVEQLNTEDQLTLLQRIAQLLKSNTVSPKAAVSLTKLSGLGSDIWKGKKEIDSYLESEREW